MDFWHVKPEWKGETAFIVGGGPSVAGQNLELLRGRRVIAVNSSYERVPWADICYFADQRWFFEHKDRPAFKAFAGRKVTCAHKPTVGDPATLRLMRIVPNFDPNYAPVGPGLALAPHAVVSNRTSLQGALNLAFHLGASRLVLLGADMARSAEGASHHHSPHPWRNKPGNETWDTQMEQLVMIVEPLRERKIEVINTSAVSRLTWWPKMTLEEASCLPNHEIPPPPSPTPRLPSILFVGPVDHTDPNMWHAYGDRFKIAELLF